MKIWVIGRSYPESGNNMIGSFELEQAKMLYKNGEIVHYLCCSLHPVKVINKWGYQSWKDEGIRVHSYSKSFFPRIYPFYLPKLRNYYWKKFLYQVYEEAGKPDIIHVHYPAMLMIADALWVFHAAGVKVVITEHWTKVQVKSLDKIEQREYKKYFKYVNTCICVGRPLANAVREIIGDVRTPVIIVPNVVDKEFQPVSTVHDGFEFIAVGRLVEVKQFDRIIDVFAESFRGKPVQLIIVGGGKEYDNLRRQITELSMEEQIILTGSLPRKQVAEHVANADCLVCYSRLETFGVPIIEAWACGIPAVITTAAAIVDIFDKRLGIEISSESTMDLQKAMLYIYKNIDQYEKKFISEFARERFSEEAVYTKLMEVYQKVREEE